MWFEFITPRIFASLFISRRSADFTFITHPLKANQLPPQGSGNAGETQFLNHRPVVVRTYASQGISLVARCWTTRIVRYVLYCE
jgi:hypothetical protein